MSTAPIKMDAVMEASRIYPRLVQLQAALAAARGNDHARTRVCVIAGAYAHDVFDVDLERLCTLLIEEILELVKRLKELGCEIPALQSVSAIDA